METHEITPSPPPVTKESPFKTSREIPASIDEVFAAIATPARLARWWGPAGFTNTFHLCEFKTGGRWSFIMHGPDGRHCPNENLFADIEPPNKIVIQHVSEPRFVLTVTLTPSATGTRVSWTQVFENPDIAARVKDIVVFANEQNLDRLTREVLDRPEAGQLPKI